MTLPEALNFSPIRQAHRVFLGQGQRNTVIVQSVISRGRESRVATVYPEQTVEPNTLETIAAFGGGTAMPIMSRPASFNEVDGFDDWLPVRQEAPVEQIKFCVNCMTPDQTATRQCTACGIMGCPKCISARFGLCQACGMERGVYSPI